MALLHIPFQHISAEHIKALLDTKAAESLYIEYKRDTYSGSDADKVEFLADVSSFANSGGGDLIIGIEAKGGVPQSYFAASFDAEKELLRLDSLARTGIEPRIPNLQVKAIELGGGQKVLLLRIPRSYNPPHRVVAQGRNRFFARSSAGKFEPNVEELRSLFNLAPRLADEMREFRVKRLTAIAGGNAPLNLLKGVKLLLHIVPFSFSDLRHSLSLTAVNERPNYFPPIAGAANNWLVNFDGFITMSNGDPNADQRAYVQVFRSGALEALAASLEHGSPPRMSIPDIEVRLINSTRRYVAALKELGAAPPYAVMVSFVDAAGVAPKYLNDWAVYEATKALRLDQYQLSEVVLESVPKTDQECASLLRPMLDQLASLAGQPACANFGADGIYKLIPVTGGS